jgi:hypothetical protein
MDAKARCENGGKWRRFDVSGIPFNVGLSFNFGECSGVSPNAGLDGLQFVRLLKQPVAGAAACPLYTPADFGCVYFEPKPEEQTCL